MFAVGGFVEYTIKAIAFPPKQKILRQPLIGARTKILFGASPFGYNLTHYKTMQRNLLPFFVVLCLVAQILLNNSYLNYN